MMVSPGTFYNQMEGKSVEELQTEIRSLKREITKLKNEIENPVEKPDLLCPSRDVRICCSREYLEMAKKALADAGGEYKETAAEKKARAFRDNLPHLTKMELQIGSYPEPCFEPHVIVVNGNEINGVGWCGSFDFPKPIETKDQLLAYLWEMHLEEWQREYRPEKYGMQVMDGAWWTLKIEYDGGIKPIEYYGHAVYPWNFDALCKLFGEDMWSRYDDEDEDNGEDEQ